MRGLLYKLYRVALKGKQTKPAKHIFFSMRTFTEHHSLGRLRYLIKCTEGRRLKSKMLTWAAENDVEVKTIDTDGGIVLDAQIDVFLDAETKVAGGGEVVATQLVLAHLQATLQNLLGLGATHRAVHSDLLVTTDSEGAHCVAGLGEHGLLTSQLLQHLWE